MEESNLTNPSKIYCIAPINFAQKNCRTRQLLTFGIYEDSEQAIQAFYKETTTTTTKSTEYLQRVRTHRTQNGPAVHLFIPYKIKRITETILS